ncbi:MAG: sigma-54 dependent transcriptional regulator [SAR324 cluster bacterium]|jgi:two-component system nitrogen regulation response regulator GlnG|nr:sigma-54 dependent transcriptional regulator [SAR324 cluster bacterium]|tara:strand:+ start:448 stop:1911 length:1464 start_codon:yes stop_codon:yes gene_type:complete
MSKLREPKQNKEPFQILVLDDEHSIRWVLERTLAQAGYIPHLAADAPAARQLLRKHSIRLALVDINLPGQDGLSFTREILQEYPYLLTIVMTGQSTMFNTVEAMKAGAFDYVAKPFNIDEIEELVKCALRVPLITSENNSAKKGKSADDLLTGQSKVMRDLYKAIGRVAATDLTVLIQGESGTGKELIARSIHQHSLRAGQPFVAINCAAIPSELMESELFGHEKGAFTGATERKRGKLELASKGTLFLDEIGDMPMKLQSKLLRVLQEKQFERLGGHELITTDMRVIAATHQNLEKLISNSEFRTDLYYRLNVFPVNIAPLRERREDIPVLVEHFLRKGSKEMAVGRKEVEPEALNILTRFNWPGNIRELENTVKSLMITNVTGTITLDSLPKNLFERQPLADSEESLEEIASLKLEALVRDAVENNSDSLMADVLPQVERPLLRLLLEQTRWNQQRASRILGINRNTLRKKIEMLGLKNQKGFDK